MIGRALSVALLASAFGAQALAAPPTAPATASAPTPGRWTSVVDAMADRIETTYVHADRGAEIARALRAEVRARAYDSAATPAALAVQLSDRLKRHDLHFNVTWSAPDAPKGGAGAPPPAAPAAAGG